MKIENIVTAESYTLRTKNGDWLGQIVLTSDGAFMSVTDYGNLSFAWRSFGDDFKKFLIGLDVSYLASKMFNGIADISHTRNTEKACERFAEKILPPLQKVLREELEEQNKESA